MSRTAVEGFVRRLFADPEFRGRSAADSGQMLHQFDLTPAERRVLTGLITRLGSGGGELPLARRQDDPLYWF